MLVLCSTEAELAGQPRRVIDGAVYEQAERRDALQAAGVLRANVFIALPELRRTWDQNISTLQTFLNAREEAIS